MLIEIQNTNDDRRNYDESHPETKREARLPAILERIENTKADFAVRFESGDDMAAAMEKAFLDKKYKVAARRYCSDPGSFWYVFAWNPETTTAELRKHMMFTTSGKSLSREERAKMTKEEQIEHGLGTQYEKSAVFWTVNGDTVIVCSHFGLDRAHKIAAAKMLNAECQEILKKDKAIKTILVCGDMNSFDNDADVFDGTTYLEPQLRALCEGSSMDSFRAFSEMGIYSTFRAFGYDLFRFMTKDQIDEVFRLRDEGQHAKVRELFDSVIAARKITKKTTGIKGWFEHPQSESILESGLLDAVVGFGDRAKGAVLGAEFFGYSDHAMITCML